MRAKSVAGSVTTSESLVLYVLFSRLILRARTPISGDFLVLTTTYDHIHETIRDPVRSPLVKLVRAKSVVGSVTTSESLVLYVFADFFGDVWSCGVVELRIVVSGLASLAKRKGETM